MLDADFWEHVEGYAKLMNRPPVHRPKNRVTRRRESTSEDPKTIWGKQRKYLRDRPAVRAAALFLLTATITPYISLVYDREADRVFNLDSKKVYEARADAYAELDLHISDNASTLSACTML